MMVCRVRRADCSQHCLSSLTWSSASSLDNLLWSRGKTLLKAGPEPDESPKHPGSSQGLKGNKPLPTVDRGGAQSIASKAHDGLHFHSLYKQDLQKVILISSDGLAFCVDKQVLAKYR